MALEYATKIYEKTFRDSEFKKYGARSQAVSRFENNKNASPLTDIAALNEILPDIKQPKGLARLNEVLNNADFEKYGIFGISPAATENYRRNQ